MGGGGKGDGEGQGMSGSRVEIPFYSVPAGDVTNMATAVVSSVWSRNCVSTAVPGYTINKYLYFRASG